MNKMKTILLCMSLLFCCTSTRCMTNNQVDEKYKLSTAEFIDMSYTSKLVLTYKDNRLIKVTDNVSYGNEMPFSERYEFDYSQIDKQIVTMVFYNYDGTWAEYITLNLNSDGAVEKATYDDGEWYEFYYNSENRLSQIIRHYEDLIEIQNMTYINGSLVKVNRNNGDAYYMTYTSEDMSTPIENEAGLMYESNILWGVNLDDFEYVYMAGLLGKAPVYLPISTHINYIDSGYRNINYKWIFDDNGNPTECRFKRENRDIIYKYSWATTETGISTITDNTDAPTIDATYTMSGTKIKSQQKGVNIIHYSDGTTRKILSK